jgi:hypothetical protein
VAPRRAHDLTGREVLELGDVHLDVSATKARTGRTDWMAPEALEFDDLTGAWTDPERYRHWLQAGAETGAGAEERA